MIDLNCTVYHMCPICITYKSTPYRCFFCMLNHYINIAHSISVHQMTLHVHYKGYSQRCLSYGLTLHSLIDKVIV